MRDGVLRASIKLLARLRFRFDVAVTRQIGRLAGKPRYQLRGSCRACGACCRTPMIQLSPLLALLPSARWLLIRWHRLINGFELLADERRSRTLVFRCTHWDHDSGRCDSYSTRPGMCRDYPRALLAAGDPQLLDGCAFRVADCHSSQLLRALDEAGLTPEQHAELVRRLHLEAPSDPGDRQEPVRSPARGGKRG